MIVRVNARAPMFSNTSLFPIAVKDGIRQEWYAKFDLASPAEDRKMPYTGVIERPDLQEIYLNNLPKGVIQNGDGVMSYTQDSVTDQVTVELESGRKITGDVLIGADGIWSAVRAKMHDQPVRGDGSGATYSGYTVFAGELNYDSPDNGEVGYKVRVRNEERRDAFPIRSLLTHFLPFVL
jgi:zeaxanthin epoxidase